MGEWIKINNLKNIKLSEGMPYKVLDGNNEVIAVCDSFIEAFSHVPFDSDFAQILDDSNHVAFMFKKGDLNREVVLKNRK